VNAYNLAFACLLLTGAALGDRFGRRRMYVFGLLTFTGASALAALSPSAGMLVGARAVQGAGAAIVMPLTLTLISEAFPAEKRGAAIGLWGGITGLGVALGPVVGGAIVNGISWHWIFWLNVPVGLAVIPLAATRLTESFGSRPQVDITGLLLAGAGAFGVTWGLVRANAAGWTSAEVIAALLVGTTFVGAFLTWERRTATPMLPIALFRERTFASTNAVSFFMYAGLFGALFLMSQFFQTVLGYTPLEAGIRLLPWAAPPMVVAPIAGALADRYGNRPFMALGLALQATGLAWVALIAAPDVGYAQLGVALTIAGIGTSFCFPTVANAIMGSVPLNEAGVASGTNSTIRELGGVLGVAVLASVFARHGVYASDRAFVDGFTQALWVAVGFSGVGVLAALLSGARPQPKNAHGLAPEIAIAGEPA
jgi:EmrB/QacA subfamily drug resistance transporter